MNDDYSPPPANAEPLNSEVLGTTGNDRPVANASSPTVGVYDRPERSGATSRIIMTVIAVVVLVLLAILLFQFVF
jgi:hypothetical protein